MALKNFNCLSIGVGGQGVIRATRILADAALLDKYDVRTAETHGMAQRGGSVTGYLRFGTQVMGPLIPKTRANLILSFELSEVLRSISYANNNTFIFVNKFTIMPLSIYQNKNINYPKFDNIRSNLNKITKKVFFIDATKMAKEAGNSKALNVVMLGAIVGAEVIPITRESVEESIMKLVPPKAKEVNKKAFEMGYQKGQEIRRNFNE